MFHRQVRVALSEKWLPVLFTTVPPGAGPERGAIASSTMSGRYSNHACERETVLDSGCAYGLTSVCADRKARRQQYVCSVVVHISAALVRGQ
jgi:hypothetical protein